MYSIEFYPKAQKFLKKVKDKGLKAKLTEAFDEILENPYVGDAKKGNLAGIYGYDVFYNKTNYEISYKIEEDRIIIVILIGTRENFYKELKKYLDT